METLTEQTPRTPPSHRRIAAIDIARGLALIGMMMVHLPLGAESPSGIWDHALQAPSGRASVLFFVLSGVSLSLIARRGSRSAEPSVVLKRGVVLFMGGVVMAQFWGATILQHYGVAFMVAPLLLRRTNRGLMVIAGTAILLGPVAAIGLGPNVFNLSMPLEAVTGWALMTLSSILFSLYALVVWIGFFAIGMLVGRADLQERRNGLRLAVIGIALATITGIAIAGTSGLVPNPEEKFTSSSSASLSREFGTEGDVLMDKAWKNSSESVPDSGLMVGKWDEDYDVEWQTPDWWELASGYPHSNAAPWALQSTGIALAVIGLLTLVPARATRFLKPLAALGSISLTAYVFHTFLVQDLWTWLEPVAPESFPWEMGRLGILIAAMLGLGWFVKRRWSQGPLEWGLHQLTDSGNAKSSTPEPSTPILVG